MSHAILSPSSSERWLTCAPSAQLEAKEPYSTSIYADEGTLAHRLCELIIQHKIGKVLNKAFNKHLKEIEAHELYTGEMYDYCDSFAVFVLEKFNSIPNAHIFTEDRVDLTRWIPQGFGTVDIRIIGGNSLHIIDFKYGKGVPVFAEDNSQLKVYALGAYEEMSHIFNIDTVEMTIYQPRIDSVTSHTMAAKDLLHWAETVLVPGAKLAYEGGGEFVPGSHCGFCRVKHKCKALAKHNLELAKEAFKEPAFLSPEEIAEIVLKEKQFTDWITSVSDYALNEAVNHGVEWPGLKIVEGRSVRKYEDEIAASSALIKAGFNSVDIWNMKLKGITDMTKLLGKADFEKVLGDFIIKPPGKPVLVSEDDKRPAFSSADRAKEAFKDH